MVDERLLRQTDEVRNEQMVSFNRSLTPPHLSNTLERAVFHCQARDDEPICAPLRCCLADDLDILDLH